MVRWRGLGNKTGFFGNRRNEMSISLPTDEDEMIGRDCTIHDCEPKYFKISMNDIPESHKTDLSNSQLFCPYCGNEDHMQSYRTQAQTDYAVSIAKRQIMGEINRSFSGMARDFNRSSPRGGFISLSMKFKPGSLPIIRKYIETDLKRIVSCDNCKGGYAVFGLARFCPWCGAGNLKIHFERNVEVISKLLTRYQIISEDDTEVGYMFLGDNLENCVGLFEGFMKQIYSKRIIEKNSDKESESKLKSIGNKFQNLNRSKKIFDDEFEIDIFENISEDDYEFLQLQFAKRHVLTHNLGLVDEKYLSQVKSWQKPGQEVPLNQDEISHTLDLIREIITNLL